MDDENDRKDGLVYQSKSRMERVTQTDLLHPELLPQTTLVEILEQKHIKLDGQQREDKEILVEIFLRTVTPQPQRQPRSNRRGQITARVIRKLDSHRVHSKSETEMSCSTGGVGSMEQKKRSQRGGLLMSTELPSSTSSTSRLKPPPIVFNKVKLTPGKPSRTHKVSESSTSPTSGVRKLAISPPATSGTTPKSTKLKVYNSSASSSKSQETLSKSGNKVTPSSGNVSLKRPSTIENGEKPMDTSDETPPKAKIKKISWP